MYPGIVVPGRSLVKGDHPNSGLVINFINEVEVGSQLCGVIFFIVRLHPRTGQTNLDVDNCLRSEDNAKGGLARRGSRSHMIRPQHAEELLHTLTFGSVQLGFEASEDSPIHDLGLSISLWIADRGEAMADI